MSDLYITEKPSAARALRAGLKAMGAGGRVVSARGHLLQLQDPDAVEPALKRWDLSALPFSIRPGLVPGKDVKEPLQEITTALKDKPTRVFLATDPGREGSLIGWEIFDYLGMSAQFLAGAIDLRRVYLGATDEQSVKKAIQDALDDPHSGRRDAAWYYEARSRQLADYLSGLNLTRFFTLTLAPKDRKMILSIGPVQTATLALLVDRELQIINFKVQSFFVPEIKLTSGNAPAFVLSWKKPQEAPYILDKSVAQGMLDEVPAELPFEVKVEKKKVRPPKLMDLSTLQSVCAKRFGWAPDKTLEVAQKLYDEGYSTYPRSECNYLHGNDTAVIEEKLAVIKTFYGDMPMPETPTVRKNYTYKDQDSEHYAIVPTAKAATGALTDEPANLYRLLAEYYVAHHHPDALIEATVITARINDDCYEARHQVVTFAGWQAVLKPATDKKEADDDTPTVPLSLPSFPQGKHEGQVTGKNIKEGKTQPPKRVAEGDLPLYMAKLINYVPKEIRGALENPANPDDPKGLGTAATRASIIKVLFNRGYLQKVKKVARPTELGMGLIHSLRAMKVPFAEPVNRALQEQKLLAIGQAEQETAKELADAYIEETERDIARIIQAPPASLKLSQEALSGFEKRTFTGAKNGGTSAASPKQIKFLKKLAKEKGFEVPATLTIADASALIEQHKG